VLYGLKIVCFRRDISFQNIEMDRSHSHSPLSENTIRRLLLNECNISNETNYCKENKKMHLHARISFFFTQ
jgi:hypothetical protein